MSEYLVNAVEVAESKRGNKYLRMKLYAPGGKLWAAMMWEASTPPPVGSVVDVLAEIDNYQGQEQLKVTALRVTDTDPSDVFLPKTPYNIDELYSELHRFSDSVNHPFRELLLKAYEDPRWKRTPAAQGMHHAYLGGLLEHTVNLCRLANVVSNLYPVINRDLLITACVIHDIGKMDELECATTIEYGNRGRLIGHISIGYERVSRWMDELDFDSELKMQVQHIILSHHGNKSYGSPVEPATIEAQLFSNLDGLDANIGKITAAMAKTAPDKEWTEPTNFKDGRFYRGKAKVCAEKSLA